MPLEKNTTLYICCSLWTKVVPKEFCSLSLGEGRGGLSGVFVCCFFVVVFFFGGGGVVWVFFVCCFKETIDSLGCFKFRVICFLLI